MNKPELDYNSIAKDISEKCNKLLTSIDDNAILYTQDAVKEVIAIAIEKYSFCVYEYWRNENADADITRKIKFTDHSNGYENLLRKWVKQNPFKTDLPVLPTDISEPYERYVARLRKKTLWLVGAGTIAIGAVCALLGKGLSFSTNTIIAIATEIIGIALVYAIVKHKRNAKREEIERQLCELEKKKEKFKVRIVDALISSAKLWLKDAVSYSDSIIEKF